MHITLHMYKEHRLMCIAGVSPIQAEKIFLFWRDCETIAYILVFPQELGWKRSDVVLSTKIFWGGKGPNDKGLSRKHIIEGTKARCTLHTCNL